MKRFRMSGILIVFCLFLLLIGMSASTVSAAYMDPVGIVLDQASMSGTDVTSGMRGTTTVDDLFLYYTVTDNSVTAIDTTPIPAGGNGIWTEWTGTASFGNNATDILWIAAAGHPTASIHPVIFSGDVNFDVVAPYVPTPVNSGAFPSSADVFIHWDDYEPTWDFTNVQTAITVTGGTVSAVPVPAAVWLLGSGLIGMLGVRRKFNK